MNFPLAQRLGLQEKSEGTDPLFRRAEANTARWDSCILWTLPAAGIVMLINNHWWPYISLVAGGIYLDAAGREWAKHISFRQEDIRVGTPQDSTIAMGLYGAMSGIALWVIFYAIWTLV